LHAAEQTVLPRDAIAMCMRDIPLVITYRTSVCPSVCYTPAQYTHCVEMTEKAYIVNFSDSSHSNLLADTEHR